MECEHGDLGVLATVEDLVVGGVPALDDLQSAVGSAAEMLPQAVAERYRPP
jgi:hypothetical protein